MEDPKNDNQYQPQIDTFWSKLWGYLSFRKADPNDPNARNFNLRAMHTINKISILMFIAAIIFLILKWTVF
ncbi:MAG: hypothetical protein H6581_17585 [Bacteroidia bacterium]|nr:hypothetical protein [Bacteroidia bacterium]